MQYEERNLRIARMAYPKSFVPTSSDAFQELTERPIADWLRHLEWALDGILVKDDDDEAVAYTPEVTKVYKTMFKLRGVLAEIPTTVTQAFRDYDDTVWDTLACAAPSSKVPALRTFGYRSTSSDERERMSALIKAGEIHTMESVVARLCKMEHDLRAKEATSAEAKKQLDIVRFDIVNTLRCQLIWDLRDLRAANDKLRCHCIRCRVRRDISGKEDLYLVKGHPVSDAETETTDEDMPAISSGGASESESEASDSEEATDADVTVTATPIAATAGDFKLTLKKKNGDKFSIDLSEAMEMYLAEKEKENEKNADREEQEMLSFLSKQIAMLASRRIQMKNGNKGAVLVLKTEVKNIKESLIAML